MGPDGTDAFTPPTDGYEEEPMSNKPAWTQRTAMSEAVNVDFSRSQVSNLRKALSGGDQESSKAKATAATGKGRAAARATKAGGTRRSASG